MTTCVYMFNGSVFKAFEPITAEICLWSE